MNRQANPSRDMLLGLLALQNGLIDQTQLASAINKCTVEPSKSLVENLLEDRSIEADQCAVLDSLAKIQIQKTGDLTQSLAASAQKVEATLRHWRFLACADRRDYRRHNRR